MLPYAVAEFDIQRLSRYNCSGFESTTTIKHDLLGVILLAIGIPAEILYFFCLLIMLQKKLRQTTCYKIMFYLVDMSAIGITCIQTGIMFREGAWFCTYPRIIYATGCLALSLWCCSCITCLILVMNRLFNLWHISAATQTRTADPVWRAGICLVLPSLYFGYFFLYTPPVLFNSEKTSWFFDPFIPGKEENVYENYAHTVNNLLIVFLTIGMYLVFVVLLRAKYKKHEQKFSFKANPVVLQAILMCFFNFIAAIIYVYMQYFPIWPPLILVGHFCWILGHGCPPFLYIYLNPTIHRRLKRIIFCGKTPTRTILPARGNLSSNVLQIKELNLPHLMRLEKPLTVEISVT